MRILRIADVTNNRTEGMARTIHFLNDALASLGHEVHALFREDLRVPGPDRLRRLTVPLLLPRLVRQFMRRGAGDGDFDVVDIHEASAAPYCALRRCAGMARRDGAAAPAGSRRRAANFGLPPVVVFSYGLEERGHAAALRYRRSKGQPVTLKRRLSPWSVVGQAWYAVRHADHVVCCSTEDLRHLRDAGVCESRLSLHRCAPHDDFLHAAPADPDADASPAILFVGSWLPRKGVEELALAVTEVLRAVPAARFTAVTHTGDASRVLTSFPEDVRARLNVVAGADGNGPLGDVYRRHTILVLPSYFEGQPMVMVEAAAYGLAVVTTATCGMLDFIRDGANGRLVEVADAKAVAAALLHLCRDPDARRRMGEAARETARALTWQAAAQSLEAAYLRAVNGSAKSSRAWSPGSASEMRPTS